MQYKRRLKKGPIIALGIFILAIILIIMGINMYKHYTSYEYKLGKVGYNEKEISKLLKMDKKYIDYALEHKYDKNLIPLISQKYFVWKNYNDYVKYMKKAYTSKKVNYKETVTLVNVKANYDPYTHTTKTNMKDGLAILVNKHYSLPDKYAPKDIVKMSNWYSYDGNSVRKEVYEAFKEMFNAAKKEDITLIVNSSYRDYDSQKQIYDKYKRENGEEYADEYAARPDFSEHQTGLALDIFTLGTNRANFEDSDGFKWLSKNAYKYGFILRYPKGKEDITGYSYESWHYRYLGKELAKKVHDSGLTYDEYYAYYLDKE